jgi:hypothetical protein
MSKKVTDFLWIRFIILSADRSQSEQEGLTAT